MTSSAPDEEIGIIKFLFGEKNTPPAKPIKPAIAYGGTLTPYANKAIEDECSTLASTTTGGRNHQLNRSAFNLASIVYAGQADEQYVIDRLEAAARACGLEGSEIGLSIRSGFQGAAARVGARQIREREPIPAADVLYIHEPTPKLNKFAAIFEAEEDFWTSRESLKQIYNGALARFCSPWAVLGHCSARALATVRPCIQLPPIIGGPGSLNLFIAVCTQSGGGKGAASAVARELVTDPIVERNAGSGEGMVQAFFRPGTKNREPEINESVMFHVDEVDTIAALNSRSGSTTAPMIRSAFSGETLGWSYKESSTIESHPYRMTLVVSVQPARAGGLLADADGGTPQRFMWFPGTDPRVSREHSGKQVYPVSLPGIREWLYPTILKVPDQVRDVVEEAAVKRGRGDVDALDGHGVFCREKFAYALAVLDGRAQMNEEDWRLSGIAAEVSTRTRAWVQSEMKRAVDDEAVERGRVMGVTYAESDAEKTQRSAERTGRVGRWILKKLEAGPLTQRELTIGAASRDRAWLRGALLALEAGGQIERRDVEGSERWALP